MTTLPTSGKWSVAHARDFFADLVRTKNLNFDKIGFVALAKKTIALFTKDTDASFGTVMAIVGISSGSASRYYIITTNSMFTWDGSDSDIAKISAASSPTFGFDSDAVPYLGILTASGGSNVKSYSGGTGGSWTSRITGLGTSAPHPLCVFENRNTLCVADGNVVRQTTSGTYTNDSTNQLTIPSEYVITGMRWRQNNLHIATRNIGGGNAKLFIWNGSGTAAQYAYDAGAEWIYSLADYQSSIVILNSVGQLLRFNGGGFDELAHFPVYDTSFSWATNSALTNSTGRCANRGMCVVGNLLNINIDGALNSSNTDYPGRYLPDQPSGLWVYDPNVGLYHRAGYAYSRFSATTFTLNSNRVTPTSASHLQTGDPVYVKSVSGISNLNAGQLYYAIAEGEASFQLAQTPADAAAGRAITLSGTPNSDTIVIDNFTSMGATYSQTFPGAVAPFITDNPPSFYGVDVMFAGDVTKPDGSSISTFMSFGRSHNVGHLITTPIPSSSITDSFNKLYQFIETLDLDDDEVVVKYRTKRRYGFPTQLRHNTGDSSYMATWTSTKSFTLDITKKDFGGAQVGDEIEIIEGSGAGYTAHITDIDTSASPSYSITLDEDILAVTVGDKFDFMVDNWKRATTSITKLNKHIGETALSADDAWVQVKVELRGHEIMANKMQFDSAVSSYPV